MLGKLTASATASLALINLSFYFLIDGEIMPPAFGGLKQRLRSMYSGVPRVISKKGTDTVRKNCVGGGGGLKKNYEPQNVEPTLPPFGGAYLSVTGHTKNIYSSETPNTTSEHVHLMTCQTEYACHPCAALYQGFT